MIMIINDLTKGKRFLYWGITKRWHQVILIVGMIIAAWALQPELSPTGFYLLISFYSIVVIGVFKIEKANYRIQRAGVSYGYTSARIFPNKHYSDQKWWRPTFGVHAMSMDVIFDKDCLSDPSDHWNKLFGFSLGLNHHENSVRVAWRKPPDSEKIQVCLYVYCGGERLIYRASIVEVVTMCEYYIKVSIRLRHPQIQVISKNKKGGGNVIGNYQSPMPFAYRFRSKFRLGYTLGFYYGGDSVPSQAKTIYYKKTDSNGRNLYME